MSKNTDKIIKALKVKGYEPVHIDWEPIGSAPIMEGPSGGWFIEYKEIGGEPLESDGLILAYNINEVMDEIEKLPECVSECISEQMR